MLVPLTAVAGSLMVMRSSSLSTRSVPGRVAGLVTFARAATPLAVDNRNRRITALIQTQCTSCSDTTNFNSWLLHDTASDFNFSPHTVASVITCADLPTYTLRHVPL